MGNRAVTASIVLQFSTENAVGSWAIREFEHGWASHVDTVLPDNRLLGARHLGGVQIREADYARFSRVQRLELPTTEAIAAVYSAFLTSQLGKPYDLTAVVSFAVGRTWRELDSWFCSELVAAGLEASGLVPSLDAPASRVTPEMLLFLCSALTRTIPMSDDRQLNAIERRVRAIQRRSARMETVQMTMKDDVAALKTSVTALITAYQTASAGVTAAVAAQVAVEEAGDDVDIQALNTAVTAALAPVAPAVAAAQAAVAKPVSAT